ncbi:MAG: EAL domain-containing protein [Rhodocyclaceae bacterium]|nr:EAL domain-containing protein [Rhodocyclaceae bacterium]
MAKPPPAPSPEFLRKVAEAEVAQFPAKGGRTRSADELLHELQVHQIELQMQNESLRQSQLALEESRDRYLSLYEFAPVGYVTVSCEGLIRQLNLTAATLLGQDRARLLNRRFAGLFIAEDRDRWHRLILTVLKRQDSSSGEFILQRGDQERFHVRLDCRAMDGGVVRASLTDVSAWKRAEEGLRIAAVAFESQEAMMVTDANSVILRVNQAFTRVTGFEADEVIGKTPAVLSSGRHDKSFYLRMWQALREQGFWQGEMWNRRKSGKIYAEWLCISVVCAPDGRISHYVGTFSEITQNKEAEAEIHRLAYYDPLTHLPNRRLLQDRIGQAMAGSSRSGHHGALLFLDLDNFKTINDTRGHEVGDQLLIETARRIQAGVREGDTVARLGGDEFVVILEDLSNEAQNAALQAGLVGEKIRDALAQAYFIGEQRHHCSASLGVTLFQNHLEPVEMLLRHADLAMYKAKEAGRNTLRFFDPAMQTAVEERSSLEADLRLALERRQLRLYYQPQVDADERLIGAEALLRWQHPDRGLVPPGDFIPLAEETGLILPIGLWVLETACANIEAWSASPILRDLRLAVNVSARQFQQPDFVAQVTGLLAQTGANPRRLKMELTESMVLKDVADTFGKMHALEALGIGFSLDDFGTGHSSLSYLTRLPLEQIKIDRSFVLNLPHSVNDGIVAQTIITMARGLGLDVIAEGVETEPQRAFLARHDCHAYQGYLFARPLPLAEFEAFAQHPREDA